MGWAQGGVRQPTKVPWCVLLFGPAAPVGLIRGRAAPDNGRARATMWTAPLMLGGGEMRLPPDDGLPEQRQVPVALYALVVVAGSAARISLLVAASEAQWLAAQKAFIKQVSRRC